MTAPAQPAALSDPRGAAWKGAWSGSPVAARVIPPVWAALALVALTLLVYLPVWSAGFIWDDDVMLNRFVQAPSGLKGIWFSTELPDYFPMTSSVLWLEWRLWAGNPLGYHLVNVALHAVAVVLLWRVLRRLAVPGAWMVAAVFAIHPVNVESVAWITEHKNTLALVFGLVTVLTFLRSEEAPAGSGRPWFVLSLVAFASALLSKTAVVPLPVVLLALAYWRRGELCRRDYGRVAPFFLLSAVLAVVTLWFQAHRAIGPAIIRTDGWAARIAGAGQAVWFYLKTAVAPTDLAFIYPRWTIDPARGAAYGGVAGIVAAAVVAWAFRRRVGRGLVVAAVGFLALLAPVVGFVDISFMRHSLVADRWQYFAIIFPIASVVALAGAALRRWAGPARTIIGGAAAAVALVALGATSWQRGHLFQNPAALWAAVLARNPTSAVAHNEVGIALAAKGELDAAIGHYRAALGSIPDYELAHYNLGCALMQKGELATAADHFGRAVRIYPTFHEARYNLGTVLLQLQRVDEAIVEFKRLVADIPDASRACNNLGAAYLQKNAIDEALVQFERAVALDANNAGAQSNVGMVLLQKGREDEAITHLQKATELNPADADSHAVLAEVFRARGNTEAAAAHTRAVEQLRAAVGAAGEGGAGHG